MTLSLFACILSDRAFIKMVRCLASDSAPFYPPTVCNRKMSFIMNRWCFSWSVWKINGGWTESWKRSKMTDRIRISKLKQKTDMLGQAWSVWCNGSERCETRCCIFLADHLQMKKKPIEVTEWLWKITPNYLLRAHCNDRGKFSPTLLVHFK